MATQPKPMPDARPLEPIQIATFPGIRALAWDGDVLYASRGYQLLRAQIFSLQMNADSIHWQPVAHYRPAWWRNISVASRLSSRLFRDGFHALAVLPSGHMVAAVPGAIITCGRGETEFRITHKIIRGTRPLHIAATPSGRLYWGEYFDNADREEVYVYASADQGASWHVAYTFPKGAVRHVHNIVYDKWEKCLWVLTGDDRSECRILKADLEFKHVETVLGGNQQARAVACLPAEDGLYFSSDTPLESNYIYHHDRRGNLSRIGELNGSSIYGCRVRSALFFSTMVEPSEVNRSNQARLYASGDGSEWKSLLRWEKDSWPMELFQFGNVFLPDGENATDILAVSTIALKGADMQTSLWRLEK
jgi:hypothetical protein